jgi:hypothetical protein
VGCSRQTIGWLVLDRPYRAGYERVGCFECDAAGHGIAAKARRLIEADDRYDPDHAP